MSLRRTLPAVLLLCSCASSARERPAPRLRPPTATPAPARNTQPQKAKPAGARPPPIQVPLALAEVADPVPLTLVAVGHTGGWLVQCAARTDTDKSGDLKVSVGPLGVLGGDALEPELVVGREAPQPIDDLFGFDPLGRFVVVRSGGSVTLLDTVKGTTVDLGALGFDTRDDVLDRRQHRALAFDPRGELLAYLRQGAPPALVLRTLATGEERVVSDLGGEPWRLTWDGRGDALVLSVVGEDTTKDGRLTFPYRLATRPRLRCEGPIPRFQVSAETGDRASSVVIRRDGKIATRLGDLALPFGAGVVRRASDGALVSEQGGQRSTLASSECGARVLHADAEQGLLLVSCGGGKNPQKAEVELVGPGYRKPLGVVVQPLAIDRWPEPPARLHALYPGPDTALVDFKERRLLTLKPGDRVIATSGSRAFVRRDKLLQVIDVERQAERTLLSGLPRGAASLVELPFAVIGGQLVDLDAERAVGTVTDRPLALTPAGDVLLARGKDQSVESLILGPLGWQRVQAEQRGGVAKRPAPLTHRPGVATLK